MGDTMEHVIEALIALVQRDPQRAASPRELRADLTRAPACVRALGDALATCSFTVDLGEFYLHAEDRPVESLAPAFEMAGDVLADLDEDLDALLATAGPGGTAVDPASTLLLAYDGGGMSALGVAWPDGAPHVVIVEMEDPTEDNVITWLSTPQAVVAELDDRRRGEAAPGLDALRGALGLAVVAPEPATPPSALRPWDGPPPAHPHGEAMAQFPGARVLQAAPTQAGRVVVARRTAFGPPPVTAALAARAGGAGTPVDWPGDVDIFALCPVPGTERVLVCTGAPGPLIEVDLASGARRERLPSVGWSCGFVDPDHLAVLADGEVRVYRWGDGDLASPVATAPAAVSNLFVAHGHVLGRTRDYSVTTFQVLRWDGATLVDVGVHEVPGKLFALHAAVDHAGARLVAGIDMRNEAHWVAFTPA